MVIDADDGHLVVAQQVLGYGLGEAQPVKDGPKTASSSMETTSTSKSWVARLTRRRGSAAWPS